MELLYLRLRRPLRGTKRGSLARRDCGLRVARLKHVEKAERSKVSCPVSVRMFSIGSPFQPPVERMTCSTGRARIVCRAFASLAQCARLVPHTMWYAEG